jgi:hypothetical protein
MAAGLLDQNNELIPIAVHGWQGCHHHRDGWNILETAKQVLKAFIQGRFVDLSSKHTQLNDMYTAKYKQ